MSLFESQIDYEFVGAVKKIGRELEALNKNLKENAEEKAGASAEDSNKNSKIRVENIGSRLPFGNETLRERFKDWKEIPINGNSQFPMIYGDFKINLYREPDSITRQRIYVLVASVGSFEIFAVEANMETPEESFNRITRERLIGDAKLVYKKRCENAGTHLAESFTEKDFGEIADYYLANFDAEEDKESQLWNATDHQICKIIREKGDDLLICQVVPAEGENLQNISEEMREEEIPFVRVTDVIFIMDRKAMENVLQNDRVDRVVYKSFKECFSFDGYDYCSISSIKMNCINALLIAYTDMCGGPWDKDYPDLQDILYKCSLKKEAE